MNRYEEIKKIIEEAGEDVEFAEFGEGISEEWIEKAEKRLKMKLPESYKWWLKNYGGGEIYGEESFSIYEQDFDSVVGGDIVYMYELNKKLYHYSNNMLAVCETEDEIFYFNTAEKTDNHEYPVYSLNANEKYADDFLEFLKKRILND